MHTRRSTSPPAPTLAALLVAALGALPAQCEIPRFFEALDESNRSLWVPLDEAIVDGVVQGHLLRPELAASIEHDIELLGRRPPTDEHCSITSMPLHQTPGDIAAANNAEEFAATWEHIVLGVVEESTQGFFRNTMGTLYAMRIERWLKSPPEQTPERLYIFYPVAEISIDDGRLCYAARRGMERPSQGAEVLLALPADGSNGEPIVSLTDDQLVFQNPGATVSFPAASELAAASIPLETFTADLEDPEQWTTGE